jgi:DNA-binding MarR family transcriptional regulator
MANWMLITNHAGVLLHIAQHPRTTAREIAATVGITERATRKIIADLDEARFISKKKEGRRILYTINHEAKMRRDNVQEIAVGKFLEALGWQKVIIEVKPPVISGVENAPVVSLYKSPSQKELLVDEFYSNLF